VHTNDEGSAERLRAREVSHVAPMKNVENPVREDDRRSQHRAPHGERFAGNDLAFERNGGNGGHGGTRSMDAERPHAAALADPGSGQKDSKVTKSPPGRGTTTSRRRARRFDTAFIDPLGATSGLTLGAFKRADARPNPLPAGAR